MENIPNSAQPLLSRQKIVDIKRRFQNLHRIRLLRIQDSLRTKQKFFLDLLALFFHINHEMLPGWISAKTPCGISDYRPAAKSIESIKKRHKGFQYRVKAMQEYPILSVFLMGSVGSIAYSRKSDFDIWICVKPNLSEEEFQLLRQKTEKIQRWAEAELSLEVHFFIMNPDHFREFGHKQSHSEDSSGNSQHHLLLEEFYRTSLLIAGRFPVWWLVPVEQEHRYEEYVQDLCTAGLVQPFEYLDFGGLTNVDISEFFGSALWQLYKAVHSPYKSFLKIILMEAYASDYPDFDFPCQRMKQAIHEGEQDTDKLDPYILMTSKVESHLINIQEMDRLELARRCFYYKIHEPMSKANLPMTPRRETLQKLVERWGWDLNRLKILDQRSQWKCRMVMEERELLIEQLTRSYKRLAEFSRKNAHYTARDAANLNILGRKLYSAFEKKAGKVEFINPRLAFEMAEEKISFIQNPTTSQEGWLLYDSENSDADEFIREPIKISRSLIEIVAWCYFNAILDRTTSILLQANNKMMSYRELRGYISWLSQVFPKRTIPEPTTRDLAKPEAVRHAYFFINVGHDPLFGYSNQGLELVSAKTDALCYSGFSKNLIYSFDAIFVTSWQEILVSRHSGDCALLDAVCDYLAWFPLKGDEVPAKFECICISGTKGPSIANRVQQIMGTLVNLYYQGTARNTRFILRMENAYFIVQPERGFASYSQHKTYQQLITALGLPRNEYSKILPDKTVFANSPLTEICSQDVANLVQIYFHIKGPEIDVYLMDERGSLTIQTCRFFSLESILQQYRNFMDSISFRKNQHMNIEDLEGMQNAYAFYEIRKSFQGHFIISPIPPTLSAPVFEQVNIRVLGELGQQGRIVYSIYCNDRQHSSLDQDNQIFDAVAKDILNIRKGRGNHPVYISDIDISRSFVGANAIQHLQTCHFVQYKKWIEDQLSDALVRISRT